MTIKLGEKIKNLRKEKGISQERLAQVLGVSFQSVSKWETGATMPDIILIPMLASFFGVSIDELFDYNTMENERKADEIGRAASGIMCTDPERAEAMVRDGLARFPANENLLTVLLYILRLRPGREADVIEVCRTLLEYSTIEGVKCDIYKILAETYAATGKQELVGPVLEKIPEFYFTKMECIAKLTSGEKALEAAKFQMNLSANSTVEMLQIMEKQYTSQMSDDTAATCRRIAAGIIKVYQQENGEQFEEPGYQWIKQKQMLAELKK